MAKVAKKLCNFRLPVGILKTIKQLAKDGDKSQSEVVEQAVVLLASGKAFGLNHVRLPSEPIREMTVEPFEDI